MGSITKGIGGAFGSALGGGLAGAGIGLLSSAFSGGKKKSKGFDSSMQSELLSRVLPFVNDPGLAVQQFNRDNYGQAAAMGQRIGGLIGSQTNNPYAEGAIKLGYQNRATEASNQFAQNAYSTEGRAQTAQGLLPFYSDIANQQLQRRQINLNYGKPTFANTLFSTTAGALPWYLQYRQNQDNRNTGGGSDVSSDGGGQSVPTYRR